MILYAKNCKKQHEVKCKLSFKLNPSRVQITFSISYCQPCRVDQFPLGYLQASKKDFPQDFIYLLTIVTEKVL